MRCLEGFEQKMIGRKKYALVLCLEKSNWIRVRCVSGARSDDIRRE